MGDKNIAIRNRLFRYLIVFAGFLLVMLLTITDKYISHHPALVIFYIIPVSLVTWFSGPITGTFIALCSVIFWFSKNTTVIKDLYAYPVFFYINITLRGSFLFIIVYVLQRLKTALARERELNELKSIFVATASHELKSPLAIIKESYAIILDGLAGNITPEQRKLLEDGKRNVERLIRLVTNLLDVSKIETGKMTVLNEKVDISQLTDKILKEYAVVLSKKRLALKTEIQKDVGSILGDTDKLTQVITNLLSNAVKYSPVGGDISIKLTGTEKEIRFEISDSGPGISKDDIGKLFNEYERLTAEKQEGTGLGLYISKNIIELHKGKIWVESEPGKGSSFIFILPRYMT